MTDVVRLADRPDLVGAMWDAGDAAWPDFLQADPVGDLFYGRLTHDFAGWCLLGLDAGTVVARACFIPFVHEGPGLPDRGWDAVIEAGVADHDAGRAPTAVSALEVAVVPSHRGQALSTVLLAAMRRAVEDLGLLDLFAPVRPSGKGEHPTEPMSDYLARTRDGLPADPWLRVHVRAGARVVGVAPESMRIEAPLEQWRAWTGLPFDGGTEVVVPGALVPVSVDTVHGVARYVEPNVWVHHDLRR